MNPETQRYVDEQIKLHIHDGNLSQRINFFDIFGYTEPVNVSSATIATTGNTDVYLIAPRTLNVTSVLFSGVDALATSDTNYITWTVTNLGQAGAGSLAILKATDVNTTKTTGGSAISANTVRSLSVSDALSNTQVTQGDRIRIRAAVTGTLANTVTFPNYLILFS